MIRALWLFLVLAPASAGAFELAFPVQCTLNQTCFIQQYPDEDPGPGARDYRCGPLSYDGHDGTDIALPTRADMTAGVAVLAAASGTVLRTRDGMRDGPPDGDVVNRECGNGVLMDHGAGWQTQYCHLRQGSIKVQQGQFVATGTQLGLIGQSGQAEFPHLHLAVRQNGAAIDPFASNATRCGTVTDSLWANPPAYRPGGILGLGFASDIPDFETIKAGLPSATLTRTAPALVLWVHLFGAQAGDRMRLRIVGPQGAVIDTTLQIDQSQARLFRAAGKRLTATGWPAGTYTGSADLIRGTTRLEHQDTTLTLLP